MKRVMVLLSRACWLACVLSPLIGLFAGSPTADGPRPVYVGTGLTPNDIIVVSAAIAARGDNAIFLLDTPTNRSYLNAFLKAYRPSAVVPIGPLAEVRKLQEALERQSNRSVTWQPGSAELWQILSKADEAVVCAAKPRTLLLQAACLAGAARAPLFVLDRASRQAAELQRWLDRWQIRKVRALGEEAAKMCRELPGIKMELLPDERAVVAAYLGIHRKKERISTLVVANPADMDMGAMSNLAPWIALKRQAALLLTNPKGQDAAVLLRTALKDPALQQAEYLILAAHLQAIPMETHINMMLSQKEPVMTEPPAPVNEELLTLATGRLFHEEPGIVTLMLARQQLLPRAGAPRRALIASNPGDGLPLLETVSRHTAKELQNAGYETTALFQRQVEKDSLRRLLPEQDIFLWEGHLATLQRLGVAQWPEPLAPSVVLLQTCLALTESEAQPFLRRGAVAVVGSPARTYSASGAALTLAFFNALSYDGQSVGQALRQAKNFLLAYAQLKEARMGPAAELGGASRRSAWSFTLWGDPTTRLPAPPFPHNRRPAIRTIIHDNRITLRLPKESYEEVRTDKYTARLWPNGRLAGYLTKSAGEGPRRLQPLVFAEVALPGARGKPAPRLHGNLDRKRWVFLWDGRRGTGYVLMIPPVNPQPETHFHVKWPE